MDSLAPILNALQSAGPERESAELQLNARIAESPAETLHGLTTGAATWSEEALRTFALVLVRRLAFKTVEPSSQADQAGSGADISTGEGRQVWDQLAESARAQVQAALLTCLERAATRRELERNAICDTVAEVQNASLARQSEPEVLLLLRDAFTLTKCGFGADPIRSSSLARAWTCALCHVSVRSAGPARGDLQNLLTMRGSPRI